MGATSIETGRPRQNNQHRARRERDRVWGMRPGAGRGARALGAEHHARGGPQVHLLMVQSGCALAHRKTSMVGGLAIQCATVGCRNGTWNSSQCCGFAIRHARTISSITSDLLYHNRDSPVSQSRSPQATRLLRRLIAVPGMRPRVIAIEVPAMQSPSNLLKPAAARRCGSDRMPRAAVRRWCPISGIGMSCVTGVAGRCPGRLCQQIG